MPQLDFTTYVPQVIWLLVFFYFFFLFFWKEFFSLTLSLLKTREKLIFLFFSSFAGVKNNINTTKNLEKDDLIEIFKFFSSFYANLKFNVENTVEVQKNIWLNFLGNFYSYFFFSSETLIIFLNELMLLLDEDLDINDTTEFFDTLEVLLEDDI